MRTTFSTFSLTVLCLLLGLDALTLRGTPDVLSRTREVLSRTRDGGGGGEVKVLSRTRRGWRWNQFYLLEEYTGSDYQYVGKLSSDVDSGDGQVKYVLSGEGAGSVFVLNEENGDLQATRRLDREEKAFYVLRAAVVDRRTGRTLEPETEFTVKLHDVNDNEPRFQQEVYQASVPERSPAGTSVIQVTATDADDSMYGNSAKLVYSLSQGHPYFSVEPNTGVIRTALGPRDLDREQRENYVVVIEAKDMAGQNGGLTGSTTVNVTLTDVNDNPPRFTHSLFQFRVPESAVPGSPVGRISATDRDVGRNAEMRFSVVSGDGLDVFYVSTDPETQQGVLTVAKALDFEKKPSYTVEIRVQNPDLDPRFGSPGSGDVARVRISVDDVDEPPTFSRSRYLMEVKEDAAVGLVVGGVSAADPDAARRPVRYSIDRRSDPDGFFSVDPGNGSVFLLRGLDRETRAWHNLSVVATETGNRGVAMETGSGGLSGAVSVSVRLLDVNDNAPEFAANYETFVCERTKPGQRIQTVSAVDADDPPNGHRFYYSLAPEENQRGNFTLRDNGDNTAEILTRGSAYSRLHHSVYLVAVVMSDGSAPPQSSTGTLTVRVCSCDRHGNVEACGTDAMTGSPGISTGALVAILLCALVLLLMVTVFAAFRRQKKAEPLIASKEDIRDNVVSYNDEGGGEEDTDAFDIGALRHPDSLEANQQRRDIIPTLYRSPAPSALLAPPLATATPRDNGDVRDFINRKVLENDGNATAPPYDSLATYAYEGAGSVAESLSSLGSASSSGGAEQDYHYLSDWGPRFRRLADLYGTEDGEFS